MGAKSGNLASHGIKFIWVSSKKIKLTLATWVNSNILLKYWIPEPIKVMKTIRLHYFLKITLGCHVASIKD